MRRTCPRLSRQACFYQCPVFPSQPFRVCSCRSWAWGVWLTRIRTMVTIRLARVHRRAAVGLAVVLGCFGSAASAVVIDSTNPDYSMVRSAPADDPGWNRVGKVGTGAGSGVYLGQGWVLTASHVGDGDFTVDGQTHLAKAGTKQQLKNPDDSPTDLIVYELQTSPNLGDVRISSSRPDANSSVTMIGYGLEQQPSMRYWDANWATLPSFAGSAYRGYSLGSDWTKQWGTNFLLPYSQQQPNENLLVDSGSGVVSSFVTWFWNDVGNTTFAQAVPGDSGGAVFYKNGSLWELAGIMHGSSTFSGQNKWTTVAYDQYTYSADLSVYRDQIVEITAVPEPGTVGLAVAAVATGFFSRGLRRRRAGRRIVEATEARSAREESWGGSCV